MRVYTLFFERCTQGLGSSKSWSIIIWENLGAEMWRWVAWNCVHLFVWLRSNYSGGIALRNWWEQSLRCRIWHCVSRWMWQLKSWIFWTIVLFNHWLNILMSHILCAKHWNSFSHGGGPQGFILQKGWWDWATECGVVLSSWRSDCGPGLVWKSLLTTVAVGNLWRCGFKAESQLKWCKYLQDCS